MRIATAALLIVLSGAIPVRAQGNEAPVAFRHVSVLPMDRDIVLADQAVLVRNGRIAWMGPDRAAHIPSSARAIDGHGKYLLPGLVDFHTHPEPSDLVSYVDNGITTIAALDGEPLRWRALGLKLPAIAPNLLPATSILDGREPAHRHNYSVGDPADVPAILDPMIANGAVMAKIYSNMTRPEMEAIVAQAHLRGMPVIGHIPQHLPREYVLGGHGLDMVAHSEELTHYLKAAPTDDEVQALVDLVVRNRIVVTPNLVVIAKIEGQANDLHAILNDQRSAFLPPNLYQEWLLRNNSYANRKNVSAFVAAIRQQLAVQENLTRRLAASGGLLLAGTDAPDTCWPGECLYDELTLLSANGLGNYGALRAATFNAGLFAGEQIRSLSAERFGVIAVGARADLLLLDANPLDDLSAVQRIAGVMVAGLWRDKAVLDKARASQLPTLHRMHAAVDRYEQLYTAGDAAALTAYLDTLAPGSQWPFSEDILATDASRWRKAGRGEDALALLKHVERLMPRSIAVHNALGQQALLSKDYATARSAFADSLAFAPRNAVAVKGLSDAIAGAAAP